MRCSCGCGWDDVCRCGNWNAGCDAVLVNAREFAYFILNQQKMAVFLQGGLSNLNHKFDGSIGRIEGLQMGLSAHLSVPKEGCEQLLNWLQPVFTDDNYEANLVARLEGTCYWMLHRPQYENWVVPSDNSEATKFLWIHVPQYSTSLSKTGTIPHRWHTLDVTTPAVSDCSVMLRSYSRSRVFLCNSSSERISSVLPRLFPYYLSHRAHRLGPMQVTEGSRSPLL